MPGCCSLPLTLPGVSPTPDTDTLLTLLVSLWSVDVRMPSAPPWRPRAPDDAPSPWLLSRRSARPLKLSLPCLRPCPDPPADTAASCMPRLELREELRRMPCCCTSCPPCAWLPPATPAGVPAAAGTSCCPGITAGTLLVATFWLHQEPKEDRSAGGAAAKLAPAASAADGCLSAGRCGLLGSVQHKRRQKVQVEPAVVAGACSYASEAVKSIANSRQAAPRHGPPTQPAYSQG